MGKMAAIHDPPRRVLVSLFFLISFSNASTHVKTVLQDSSVEISCSSSVIPPTWTFTHPKLNRQKTLAFSGTQPHPDLKDSRFSFTEIDSVYVLKISKANLKDAGNYNCHGDKLQQTLLNVVR